MSTVGQTKKQIRKRKPMRASYFLNKKLKNDKGCRDSLKQGRAIKQPVCFLPIFLLSFLPPY